MIDRLRLLAVLAVRSVFAHKVKSLFVGSILFFGTFLVVFGSAVLNSVEDAMQRSLTSSLTGHLQIYAADAKDELDMFGGTGLGAVDIGEIDNFVEIEQALVQLDNVKAVVPMGITQTTVFGRTTLDTVLEDLREAVKNGDAEQQQALIARVKLIAAGMERDHERSAKLNRDKTKVRKERKALQRVQQESFWMRFEIDPLRTIDHLDTEVAPIGAAADGYFLRAVGTDLEQFPKAFDSFYIVQGQGVPPGKRGFLFSNRTYEKVIKNPVARVLDDAHKHVVDGSRIADDPMLVDKIRINSKQYRRVVYQLGPRETRTVHAELVELLGHDGDFDSLVQDLLNVDDSNVRAHHAFFYEKVAPHITLYDPKIGEDITLRGFTSSGYMRSVNVRIYGTYEFQGLDSADIWTASNLTDLVTFRQLYGQMTERDLNELADIKKSVGVADVSRANAEDALFGGGSTASAASADANAFDVDFKVKTSTLAETWSQQEMRDGLALNAAIVLHDDHRIAETQAAVDALIQQHGWNLQVVDWQTAAGATGQYVIVMRIVLWVALFIIFLVALIIINNAMVSATLDRTAEIGTMRAIGAQRSLVIGLFVAETLLLGLLAGGAGAACGAVAILYLGRAGIPAFGEAIVMMFAGPYLYPSIGVSELVFGMFTIGGVAVLSALYPAWIASRISPVVAMAGRE